MEWQLLNLPVTPRFSTATSLATWCPTVSTDENKPKKTNAARKGKKKGSTHEVSKTSRRSKSRATDTDEDAEEDADNASDGSAEGVDATSYNPGTRATVLESDPRHLTSLTDEATQLNMVLSTSIKNAKLSSRSRVGARAQLDEWTQPWVRSISFSPDDYAKKSPSFRALSFLSYHTFEWLSVSGNNESRFRREAVNAAIHEHCVVFGYRDALLSHTEGGAAVIRATLERVVVPFMLEGKGTKAPHPDRKRLLSWPDQIVFDSNAAYAKAPRFHLFSELGKRDRRVKMSSQKKSIVSVVTAVNNCDFACDSSTSTQKNKVLFSEIREALNNLVVVSLCPFFFDDTVVLSFAYHSLSQLLDKSAYFVRDTTIDPQDRFEHDVPNHESINPYISHHDVLKPFLSQSRSSENHVTTKSKPVTLPPVFAPSRTDEMKKKETELREDFWVEFISGPSSEALSQIIMNDRSLYSMRARSSRVSHGLVCREHTRHCK